MSLTVVSVHLTGVDATLAKLEAMERRFARLPIVAAESGRLRVARRFAVTKTAPGGKPWAPWSRNYRPKSGSLLVQSGRMANSIMSSARPGFGVISTNEEKAPWHHYGVMKGGKVFIPARPFMGLDADDVAYVSKALTAFVLRGQQQLSGPTR